MYLAETLFHAQQGSSVLARMSQHQIAALDPAGEGVLLSVRESHRPLNAGGRWAV